MSRSKIQWSLFRRLSGQQKKIPDDLKPPVQPNKLFGPDMKTWTYYKSGFHKYGLMRDDIMYESPIVQEALKRLPQDVMDERVFRIVRAGYLDLKKEVLPEEQWMTLEQDVHYLSPIVEQVKKEHEEKQKWENDVIGPY